MKYKNRIKRKQFVRDVKWKLKRNVQAVVNSVIKYIEGQRTFYEVVYNEIREGLDFGYEVRCYLYKGKHYMLSVEAMYDEYKLNPEDKLSTEKMFDLLVDKILPMQLSKYSDVILETSEDIYGKYFEVKLVD